MLQAPLMVEGQCNLITLISTAGWSLGLACAHQLRYGWHPKTQEIAGIVSNGHNYLVGGKQLMPSLLLPVSTLPLATFLFPWQLSYLGEWVLRFGDEQRLNGQLTGQACPGHSGSPMFAWDIAIACGWCWKQLWQHDKKKLYTVLPPFLLLPPFQSHLLYFHPFHLLPLHLPLVFPLPLPPLLPFPLFLPSPPLPSSPFLPLTFTSLTSLPRSVSPHASNLPLPLLLFPVWCSFRG